MGAQCVGHVVRCRLCSTPRVRGFPVYMHVSHSAKSAVGWCGAWSCAGTVDMGVRGWGAMGGERAQCVEHSVRCRLRAAPLLRGSPMYMPACYSAMCAVGCCGVWGCVGTVDMGVRGVGRGGQVRAQCVGRGERCRLRAAPHLRGFPVYMHAGYSAVCAAGFAVRGAALEPRTWVCGGWGVEGWGVHNVSGMV